MDITKYEKIFVQESDKYLKELDALLLEAEKELGNCDLWSEIHGKVHSIKGMAKALSFDRITRLSHSMETWCQQFQKGKAATPGAVQLILEGADLLRVLVAGKGKIDSPQNQKWYDALSSKFEKGPEEVTAASPPEDRSYYSTPLVPERIDQVRINYPLIDELLGFSQEILYLEKSLPPLSNESAGLRNWIDHYSSMLKGLYFRLTQLRLMSVGDFAQLFLKTMRNLAREENKQVRGEVIGGEVQADIALLERLREPIIHLLRNSIVHGIESPEERVRAGKKAEGKITFEARRERDSLYLRIGDDGRGLNRSTIVKYLKEKRALTDEQIAAMSEEALLNTIVNSDFSSAHETSDLAGRGIGMSVVAQAMEYLGGSMTIRSEPSKGTQFILRLPLSLSVIYAVSFKIGDYPLSIPTLYVESVGRRESIEPRDSRSLCDLRVLLGVENKGAEVTHIIKLRGPEEVKGIAALGPKHLVPREGVADNGHIELAVGRVIGNRPLMVLPLGDLLARAGIFSGVGVMESGELSILLDPENLRHYSPPPNKGGFNVTQNIG
ncbi:MAG: ATP-binding protein [Pseudomonadota bacterium]